MIVACRAYFYIHINLGYEITDFIPAIVERPTGSIIVRRSAALAENQQRSSGKQKSDSSSCVHHEKSYSHGLSWWQSSLVPSIGRHVIAVQ